MSRLINTAPRAHTQDKVNHPHEIETGIWEAGDPIPRGNRCRDAIRPVGERRGFGGGRRFAECTWMLSNCLFILAYGILDAHSRETSDLAVGPPFAGYLV